MADGGYEQNISVELLENFEKVSERLEKLANKMETLKTNLRKVANALEKLGTVADNLQKLNNTDLSKLDTQMGRVAKGVKTLEDALSQIKTPRMDGLKNFLDSFKNLSKVEKLKEVPKAMQSIENLDLEKLGRVFSTLDTQITPFITKLKEGLQEINKLGYLDRVLSSVRGVEKHSRQLDRVKQKTKEVNRESVHLEKTLRRVFTVGNIIYFYNMTKRMFENIGNSMRKAIDFTEIENYFSRAMGNMRSEAMKFQKTLSETFGLAMPDTMQMQATFRNMLGSLGGLADDVAYKLSERVTKMTVDFSSLYNVSIEQAATKFQAALSKQVRPIRSVSGYDITQNVLESTMREIGIYDMKISKMNELEKRLLIILTLQSQMVRSSAMGDFARTIEQPANQLRVLQQQLAEVQRWLGAVFYGTIGKILPYINGFVMAIKELIKTFALFVGYEIPNSAGQTGTILDGIQEDMSGVVGSVGDVNSGLDDTNKKLKEMKGSLASFDKLNVIGKPKEDNARPSGGASGGGLGMSVDPRILKALEDYDYMFGNIRMKATQVKENLLGWVEQAKKFMKLNVFKPIENSWKKHGDGILNNLKNSADDLIHIFSGMFDVVMDKWKPLFQSATNLFMSLKKRATLELSIVTRFLRNVWDSGGEYLFESLIDLGIAFMDLAESVNENFVIPLLRWFGFDIANSFGLLVGVVARVTGAITKFFATIIEKVSKTKAILIPATSAVVGFIGAWKIAKLLQDFQKLDAGMSVFKRLGIVLMENNSVIKKVFNTFFVGESKISGFKASYIALNNVLANTRVWNTLGGALTKFSTKLLDTSAKMSATGTVATSLASKLVGGLGKAIAFLSANPMVALGIAIGSVVGAFTLLASKQKESKYEMEDYSKAVQNQIKDAEDLQKSLKLAKDEAYATRNDQLADIKIVETYISKLREMSSENGYVDNMALAKTYVEKINSLLPETVELTKDGKIEWKATQEEIYKNIDALKEYARIQAMQELYTQAIKNELKAKQELNNVQRELNKKIERMHEIERENGSKPLTGKLRKEYEQLYADVDGLTNAQNKYSKALDKSVDASRYYEQQMKEVSSSTEDTTTKLKNSYQKLSTSGSVAFDELGNKLIELKSIHADYVSKGLDNNSKEMKNNRETRAEIIKSYAQQSVAYNQTYTDLLDILERQGIKLSKGEKKLLKESYESHRKTNEDILKIVEITGDKRNAQQQADFTKFLTDLKNNNVLIKTENSSLYWNMYNEFVKHGVNMTTEQKAQSIRLLALLTQENIDINSKEGQRYWNSFLNAQKGGNDAGNEFVNNLAKRLNAGLPKVDSETYRIVNSVEEKTKRAKPTITVSIWDNATHGASVLLNTVADFFNRNPVTIKAKLNKPKLGSGKFIVEQYASGGFPDVGQMFIARESGPELVGNIGGRPAVANNDQIVEGIASGVYSAVRDAMSDSQSNQNQPIIVENYNVVDGKVMQKQVNKANVQHNKRTGKPLFKK